MNLIDELIETLELMLNPNSADLGIKLFLEREILTIKNFQGF